MDYLAAILQAKVQETVQRIDIIIKEQHPKILAKMAEELFANEGDFNGRSQWEANKPSTIKRKGGNSPNIDTGHLEQEMSTPGVLEDENWFDNVKPIKGSEDGYTWANKYRKFDDIGRTPEDEKYIEAELEKVINNELPNS